MHEWNLQIFHQCFGAWSESIPNWLLLEGVADQLCNGYIRVDGDNLVNRPQSILGKQEKQMGIVGQSSTIRHGAPIAGVSWRL